MTRERPKRPDPVEDVKRRKGLEEHEGVPHDPEEFDPLNPARQVDNGKGRPDRPKDQTQPRDEPGNAADRCR
ncbi:hypothetical protein JJJ17_19695 [Paracoccus caeni]|uniref:Uncharacterized protein n=1 Tax=Paracoccus caeni TaxID=657651 RepID=A0A934SHX4_9RHOB|nr:hypothetical protein [Paracoccus caeni]MBK4218157.1 hypothetical protein [Paracoccus caeni]